MNARPMGVSPTGNAAAKLRALADAAMTNTHAGRPARSEGNHRQRRQLAFTPSTLAVGQVDITSGKVRVHYGRGLEDRKRQAWMPIKGAAHRYRF